MKFALLWSLKTDKSFDPTGIAMCLGKLYSIKNLKDVTIVISEDAISKDAEYVLSDVDTWFAENCFGLSNSIKTNIRVHETPATVPVSSSKPKSKAKVDVVAPKVEEPKEDVTPKPKSKAKVEVVASKVEEPKEDVTPKAKSSKAKVEVVAPKVEEPKEDVTPKAKSSKAKVDVVAPKVEEPKEDVTPNAEVPKESITPKLDDILRGIEELKLLVTAKNEIRIAEEDDATYKWFYDEIFKTGFLNAQEMQGKYHHFYNAMMSSGYFDTEYAKEVASAKVVLETVKQKQKEELKKEANATSEDDPEFEDASSDDAKSLEVVTKKASKASTSKKLSEIEEVVEEKVTKASTSMELSAFDDTEDEHNWKNTSVVDYLIVNPIESYEPFFDEAIDGGVLDKPSEFLEEEAKNHTIFPPLKFVFRAFELCRLEATKAILVGQDPYPTEGAAMGLSFSHFPNRKKLQPSLQKIYKCLEFDGFSTGKKNGDLSSWAKKGVLLLNTALTVRAGLAGSHASTSSKEGPWSHFTEALLRYLNTEKDHVVVFLWGEKAIAYKKFFDAKKHLIIEAPHPVASVYGGGKKEADFVEHRPFSRANAQLKKWGKEEIDWNLE